MTGLAWGLAYANGVGQTIRIALVFVLGHFLGFSVAVATLMFFLVGRVLGKRKQGLFGPPSGGEEGLEFGYCFDVRSCLLRLFCMIASTPLIMIIIGFDPCVSAGVDLPLRSTIPAVAAHSAGLLGLQFLRKHHVSHGLELLFRDHISRI